jgi:hypothetical protein
VPPTLLTRDIWPRITKLCASGRAHVAVAFLGTSGRKLLPLRAGSVLVVGAGERCIKQGQTNPTELLKFVRAGVDVHSAADLHAKVFVFPKTAVIGSTNVSRVSRDYWQEAALLVKDKRLIKQAREFVLGLAGEPLPIERLKQLAKLYRPPKGAPKGRRTKKKEPVRSRLWIVDLDYTQWDERDHVEAKIGRPAARARLKDDEELDEFAWFGVMGALKRGDQIVQIMRQGTKRRVFPVGTCVGLRAYRVGKRRSRNAIIYVATPEGRRSIAFQAAKQRLGKEGAILSKGPVMRLVRDAGTAQAVRQLWRPR